MEHLHSGYTLEFAPGSFPLSTDSMALAGFVRLPKNAAVLDLGSGCGTLGLLLCGVPSWMFLGLVIGVLELIPYVGPVIGGVLAAVLGVMIYGLVLHLVFDCRVNFLYGMIYGIAGSLASVLGDLTFSVIKRQTGIKDYGNLIPGHGGILDRFDSMTVVGPVTEALLMILPIAEIVYG